MVVTPFARLLLVPVLLAAGLVLHGEMLSGGGAHAGAAGGEVAEHMAAREDGLATADQGLPAGDAHDMLAGCLAVLSVAVVLLAPGVGLGMTDPGTSTSGDPRPLVVRVSGLPPPASRIDQGVLLRV